MIIEIAVIVICVLLALLVGFLIPVIIELRRTIAQANEFLQGTEKELTATLKEVDETLKSVRGITDSVNKVTSDVTSVTDGFRNVAHDLRVTTSNIEDLTRKLAGHFSGMKAAFSAVAGVLINRIGESKK